MKLSPVLISASTEYFEYGRSTDSTWYIPKNTSSTEVALATAVDVVDLTTRLQTMFLNEFSTLKQTLTADLTGNNPNHSTRNDDTSNHVRGRLTADERFLNDSLHDEPQIYRWGELKKAIKKQFVRTENDCDTIVKLIQGIQWFKVIKLTEILRYMKENLDMKKQEIGYLTSRYKNKF